MRVTCQTVEEFIECLQGNADKILDEIIRVSCLEKPIDGNKRDAVKFEIYLQASAVITASDGGQYLLEVDDFCGIDYRDASKELNGTEEFNKSRKKIKDHCDYVRSYGGSNLKIRPGVINI